MITALRILWAMSYIADAIIYIWLKVSVRKLLREKLKMRGVNRVNVAMVTVVTRERRQTTAT